jgi:hypothetical protein
VLFKHAKELTRTFGGNVDDPTLMGWNLARGGKARRSKATATAKSGARSAAAVDDAS